MANEGRLGVHRRTILDHALGLGIKQDNRLVERVEHGLEGRRKEVRDRREEGQVRSNPLRYR